MRKYTNYISQLEEETGIKIKKKLIVAIKAIDSINQDQFECTADVYNESLNFWLTQYDRSLMPLDDGQRIVPHFSKYLPNRK